MTRAETLTLQRDLAARGYPLKADGIYGPRTAEAYQDWLNQHTPQDVNTPAPRAATPWWRHKVVLGLLATVLAGITARWGVDSSELTDILLKLAEVAGLILAAWGTTPAQATAVDPTLVARVGGQSMRLPSTNPLPANGQDYQPPGPFGY